MMSASVEAASQPRLSVAILTQDEERNIARVLDSVSWADEIVVLDSGSADDTVAIAREMGAKVVHEPFRGFGLQRRRSVENCTGIWVLALDADEAVTPELRDSILEAVSAGDSPHAGFECERHTCYLGAWFGSRGWHRDRIVRLVRRDRVIFDDRIIWERLSVDGSTGRLSGPLLHWTYRDVSHHMEKMAHYSRLKALQLFEAGRRGGPSTAVLHGAGRFMSGYLLKGGFLYGWPGLVYDLLGAHGTLLSYLKLWEMTEEERREGERRESNPRPPGPQPGALTD
jgi:glycosyltransferase involved in cell wall biosynthesis